ncbi:MAG: leucine-rich repeat protein [Eubacterium sp.]|nr:leucine-rich repeat protein [Eubacterium sp.]
MCKRRVSGALKKCTAVFVIMLGLVMTGPVMGYGLFYTEVSAADSSADISGSIPDETLRKVLQILANYQDKTGRNFYEDHVTNPYTIDITVMEEAREYIKAVSQEDLENYSGKINLAPYSITDITGINYAKKASEVVLPQNLSAIKGKAFYEMTKLKRVIMPETVTTIGDSAFEKCEKLESIVSYNDNPDAAEAVSDQVLHLEKVSQIGISAFASCQSVKNVSFFISANPESEFILNSNAFKSCTSLESVDLPKATLGTGVFASCRSMTSIIFDDSYTKIPDNTLTNIEPDQGLEIHFPTGLKEIGFYACDGSNIKSMNLSECSKLKKIGDYAFQHTTIASALDLSSNTELTTICQHAFASATFAQGDVRLPDSVTSMGISVFFDTRGLSSVNIPKNLPAVPGGTFMCSYDLGEVIVPENAAFTSVGAHAFDMCGHLSDTSFLNNVPGLTTLGDYAFARCIPKKADFKSGENDNFGMKTITIPATVTRIGASAFENDFLVETADFSKGSLENIPDRLMICENKNAITMKDVQLVDPVSGETKDYPFSGNDPAYKSLRTAYSYGNTSSLSSLKTVTLPTALKTIGEYAFFGNSSLEKTTWPGDQESGEGLRFASGLSAVGSYAFAACSKRTGTGEAMVISGIHLVTLPNTVETIGEGAFSDDYSLESVSLPHDLESIPAHCFDGCGYDNKYNNEHHYHGLSGISELVRLKSIGDYAFNKCYCLQKVILSSGGEDDVEFGRNLEYLGSFSFAGTDIKKASSLSRTSVDKVRPSAFENCRDLTIVYCPDSLTAIEDNAFKDCPKLQEINFPVYATLSAKMLVNNNQYGLTLTPNLGRYKNTRYRVPMNHTIDLPADAFARSNTEKISQVDPVEHSDVELSQADPRYFMVEHANNKYTITGGEKEVQGTAVRISATIPFTDSPSRTMNIDYPVDVVTVHANPETVKFEPSGFKLNSSSSGFTVKETGEGSVLYVSSTKAGNGNTLTLAASALSQDPDYPGMITDPAGWDIISGSALSLKEDSIVKKTGAESCTSSAVFEIRETGSSTIKVFLDDGTENPPSKTMVVEVIDPIKAISFLLASTRESGKEVTSLNMPVGQTDKILPTPEYTSEDDTRDFITYKSSDSSVVSVDEEGNIKALKAGNARITIGTATNNTSRTLNVNVKEEGAAVEPVSVSISGPMSGDNGCAYIGEESVFTASCLPAYASQDVTWSLRDSDLANASLTVKEGKAVLKGTTANTTVYLKAQAAGSANKSISLKVLQKTTSLEFREEPPEIEAGIVKSLKLSGDDNQTGGIVRLPAGSREGVTFTSSDENVLCLGVSSDACTEKTVTIGGSKTYANLYYKGMKQGSAVITAQAESGIKATLTVTVIEKPDGDRPAHAKSDSLAFTTDQFRLNGGSTGFIVEEKDGGYVLYVSSSKAGQNLKLTAKAQSDNQYYSGLITDPAKWEVISGNAVALKADSIEKKTVDQPSTSAFCTTAAQFTVTQAGTSTVKEYFDDGSSNPPSKTMQIEVIPPVKSISFKLESLKEVEKEFTKVNMPAGQTDQILAEPVYTNEADQRDKITYSSDNSEIVSVDANGKITARQAGSAKITIGTFMNSTSKTLTVNVKGQGQTVEPVYISNISGPMTGTNGCVYVGEQAAFEVSCLPAYASQDVTWSIGNTTYASLNTQNRNAVLTGITANQSVTLKAQIAGVSSSLSSTLNVRVLQKTSSLEFRETPPTIGAERVKSMILSSNENQTAGIVRLPNTSRESVTFTSSDDKVLTLGQSGSTCSEQEVTIGGSKSSATLYYKGLREGTAYIYARAESGAQASLKVTVIGEPITSLTCSNSNIKLARGKTVAMNLTKTPASSTEQITFESSNTGVATVDAVGNITGVAKGSARVTARSTIDKKSVTCYVTVVEEDSAAADSGQTDKSGSSGSTSSGQKAASATLDEGVTFSLNSKKYKVNKDKTLTLTGISGSGGKLVIPASISISGNTYKVTRIAASAFAGNTSLTSVNIGPNVTTIGGKAFMNCKSLKKLAGGSKVTTIGAFAFANCYSLKSLAIGVNVKTIGQKAYYKCKSVKLVIIKSKKLKKIGKYAFRTLKVGVIIKCPKKKFKLYKKLLIKSKLPKKYKLRKY